MCAKFLSVLAVFNTKYDENIWLTFYLDTLLGFPRKGSVQTLIFCPYFIRIGQVMAYFFLGHSADLIIPICDQPGSLQTTGVALAAMQTNGCSAVDAPVMVSIQLWNNSPRYVKGNEQLPLPATASVHSGTADVLTDIIGRVCYLIYVSMRHYVITTSGDIVVCFHTAVCLSC